jgi:hypothetical protein
MHCLKIAQNILTKLPQMKFTCDTSVTNKETDCNCLSPCDEISYDVEVIEGEPDLFLFNKYLEVNIRYVNFLSILGVSL